jgi:hypothetical protein
MNSGSRGNPSPKSKDLGARDRRILNDVVRSRVVTNESIRQAHLPESSANATTKVTSRLVKCGWLKPFEFQERRQYFVAGPRLIKLFGLPVNRGRPLGPQALAIQLSILEFCNTLKPALRLMLDKEMTLMLGSLTNKQMATPHAVEAGNVQGPLRIIRVDLGGTPTHVAKKLAMDIKIRESQPSYAKLLTQRSLILVVLTSTDTKKAFIEDAIRKRKWPAGIRINVIVVPCLISLIGVRK